MLPFSENAYIIYPGTKAETWVILNSSPFCFLESRESLNTTSKTNNVLYIGLLNITIKKDTSVLPMDSVKGKCGLA